MGGGGGGVTQKMVGWRLPGKEGIMGGMIPEMVRCGEVEKDRKEEIDRERGREKEKGRERKRVRESKKEREREGGRKGK